MTTIDTQFIQVLTRANFQARLAAGDVKDTSIAFIEDTDQIWAKGRYYSAIPSGGKLGLILSCNDNGEALWIDP